METHDKGNDELARLASTLSRLTTLLETQQEEEENLRSSERLSALGANYVQLCGTLAGFCGAFILFLLSPGLFPQSAPESSIILLLVSSFGYIYAAAWSALAPTLPSNVKQKRLQLSDKIFMISNLLVWSSFTMILYSLNYTWASIVSLVLLVLAVATPVILLRR